MSDSTTTTTASPVNIKPTLPSAAASQKADKPKAEAKKDPSPTPKDSAPPPQNPSPPPERPTWVIGHKNPDTDAICSAIAYADLLKRTRIPEAIPACCGPPNARTEWVLQTAGLARPRLLADVYTKAIDICNRESVTTNSGDTILQAYRRMIDGGFRSLPVTDEKGALQGILTLPDLLELLIPPINEDETAREVVTTTQNIAQILGAEIVHLTDSCEEETHFLMMVAGSSEPVMQDRIATLPSDRLLIITGDRAGVQLHAVEAGVRCLVITSGFRPSESIVLAAKHKGTAIVVTDKDTASTTQLVRGARRIQHAVSTDFIWFSPDVTTQAITERLKTVGDQSLFPVCDPQTMELLGVFSRSDLVNPPRPRLVLVDHNEFSQAVTGADEAEIIEVMDHHRLSGNLVTREPVQFINKTVGSTCTIVGRAFVNRQIQPEPPIALCLCAGIISDTLNLTSPTTTDEDRQILQWASGIANINVDQFKEAFFSAGSVLRSSQPAEAISADRKEFDEHGYSLSISQVEEIGYDYFWPSREALQEQLRNLIKEFQLDIACLLVTDITQNNSLLLIEAPDEIRKKIGYPSTDPHLFKLRDVVSRKKQLFPYLSGLLSEIPKGES